MGTTPLTQIPYPNPTDLDDPAGDMERMAEFLDLRVNCRAANQSDRDARFYQAPAQTICTAPGIMWMKMSSTENVWATIWEAGVLAGQAAAWRNVSIPAGYSTPTWKVQTKKLGSQVFFRGTLQRVDGALIGPGHNLGLFNIHPDVKPKYTLSFAIPTSINEPVPVARLDIGTDAIVRYTSQQGGVQSLQWHLNYWLD